LAITIKNCFCGNALVFEQCCQPIISGEVVAENAEALMRSRFSAYCIKNYHYILQTYISSQRKNLTIETLADSAIGIQWLSLQVLDHQTDKSTAIVKFKAFYQADSSYFVMHEISDFLLEGGKWYYSRGAMQKDSGELHPKRNDRCLCASGKKFKKCCGKQPR
jgi:SEC-C motif-containing protein